MFALAADGKTNRKGMPNPLRLAVIANAHFDTVRLPFPPAALQKLGLVLGAPLGRLLGYGAVYTPVEGEPVHRMKRRLFFAALVLALLVLAGAGALVGAGRRLRPADTTSRREILR